jgi:4-hydroxy-3-methylbut-2-enyl diphosphate reductase
MEIEKARHLGLCFGIRRAIKLLRKAARGYGGIETLGPVAHNRHLVQKLAEVGIKPLDELEQVRGKILAITVHGVSPEVLSKIENCQLNIIDTTCPIVRNAQNTAKELAEAGFDVIIFGEAKHSEVKGLLGWADGKGIAVLDVKEISDPSQLSHRLGVISQTTQSQAAFAEFTRQLVATFSPKAKEIHVVNTLCRATRQRQEAAMKLARRNELMLVVGDRGSANTKRLVEVCLPIVETHLVEGANEVHNSWFTGKHRIGITAGASTPDEVIEEVISKLRSL